MHWSCPIIKVCKKGNRREFTNTNDHSEGLGCHGLLRGSMFILMVMTLWADKQLRAERKPDQVNLTGRAAQMSSFVYVLGVSQGRWVGLCCQVRSSSLQKY